MPKEEDIKASLIELYQTVKIRKQSDIKKIDKEYLEQEKTSLLSISPLALIDYIKMHLNILINIKVSEKLSELKSNPLEFISIYGSDIPSNDYETLLRRYEADIRNYIKLVNILRIQNDELSQKQEILENQIETMQKESFNLIPTTQSIEYRKKIEELTSLVKSYEKRDLKIPLLEEKIKKQKIELDNLDLYYKKQIKSFTKKLENYEKGIYLNNNCYLNKRAKVYKPKHRLNSISPKRKNSIIKHSKYSQIKTIEDETNNADMKRTRSINNIFFKIKNNEMKNKITSNIHSNLRINGCNTNTQNTQINSQKNENIFQSPKFIDNNVGNYYDSIETDSIDNKTIIIAGTASNFRKTMNLKSNFITNKEIDKSKNKEIIRKVQTKTNVKKVMKRINSNRTSLKIPKNIPNNINTSKYVHAKEKKIPKIARYNSFKHLNGIKNRKNTNSTKENEDFNKTFSRTDCINNYISTSRYDNTNQSQRNSVKNFILNKITKVTISNGKSPVPRQRTKSKTRSIIK